jgi:hypothetical protein
MIDVPGLQILVRVAKRTTSKTLSFKSMSIIHQSLDTMQENLTVESRLEAPIDVHVAPSLFSPMHWF